ncbi:ABC transporter, ATP-binding protein [Actinomycetales bacterium JB111]|nr:ABC transporter, ATP-binding protein [Actinomycetales bacterium JB111]
MFRTRGTSHRLALDAIDLDLPRGQVHGLLGPNGAGKTTLCRIACTVLTPSGGTVEVLGHDVVSDADEVRRRVGIVFGGDRGLYGRLSARENLQFWCAMHGVPRRATAARIDELLERLGLASRATDLVETFSRGMKQRLHLARGLVADPPLLLLDEPTIGMDPVSALEFRTLVAELRAEGRTVLLTTHDMAEAQALCDTVTFIDDGRIVGSGTPGSLRALQAEGGVRVRIHGLGTEAHSTLVSHLPDDIVGEHDPATGCTDLVVDTRAAPAVVAEALRLGHVEVTTGPPTLQDVYLRLLGHRDGTDRGMAV